MAFQKTNAAATGGSSNNYTSGVRIKQEPVMAVQNWSGTTKNQNRKESNKRQKILTRTTTRKQNHVIDVEGHLIRDI